MEFVVVLVVVVVVVLVLITPLRRGMTERAEQRESAELRELEAERTSRYGEIRDAELDFRTGKLSEKDYRTIDRALRAEAVDILRRIERAGGLVGEADGRDEEEEAEQELVDSAAGEPSAGDERPDHGEPSIRPVLRVERES